MGPDGAVPGLRISNRGQDSVFVRLHLVGGGHDLEGVPVFDESEETKALWAQRASLEPSELLLGPSETSTVKVRVMPGRDRGLYPAIMADVEPLGSAGQGVVTFTRVAIPVLLTLPGRGQDLLGEHGGVIASRVEIEQERTGSPIRISAVIENNGQVHVRSGARASIQGPGVAGEVVLKPVTILPGAARRVQGQWTPSTLPPGDYTVTLVPDSPAGGPSRLAMASFSVNRPYELALARPYLELFSVSDVSGHELSVEAIIANRGSAAGQVRLAVRVTDAGGREVGYREWAKELAPSAGREIGGHVALHVSTPGEYVATALLWHEERQISRERRFFQVAKTSLVASR